MAVLDRFYCTILWSKSVLIGTDATYQKILGVHLTAWCGVSKIVNGMANSVNPDQTALLRAV